MKKFKRRTGPNRRRLKGELPPTPTTEIATVSLNGEPLAYCPTHGSAMEVAAKEAKRLGLKMRVFYVDETGDKTLSIERYTLRDLGLTQEEIAAYSSTQALLDQLNGE